MGSSMLSLSSRVVSLPWTPSCSRQVGAALLPYSHEGPRPMLSVHELSLSMSEPILSLSMPLLAKSGSKWVEAQWFGLTLSSCLNAMA